MDRDTWTWTWTWAGSTLYTILRHFVPFDILYHSTFCPIWHFSIRHFVSFDVISVRQFVPFDVLSHSTFFTFDILSLRWFVPLDILSVRHFVSFDILAFGIVSNSTFCRSTFCPFGVCDFDILSVNHGTVFLPSEEVFARPGPAAPSQVPQMRYPSHQRAPPKRLDLWPLLLPAEARARGEPCGPLPTSLVGGQTSGCIPATLDSTCTVPVYKLICNCK